MRSLARCLKELGLATSVPGGSVPRSTSFPRIRVQRARPGFHHPTRKAQIRSVLEWFGPECTYGVESIELVQGTSAAGCYSLQFGTLKVPGRILLYEQPRGDWIIPGDLAEADVTLLMSAGAVISSMTGLASGSMSTA